MSNEAKRVLVEVCVGSVGDIDAAMAAGADRVELCVGLEVGGLTPSAGLVETALAASRLPSVAMLRPRAGGFCYDRAEFAAMVRDAERFLDLGVSGIVFGVLDRAGRLDAARVGELVHMAGDAEAVFHRAFDFVADRRAALETLVEVGCQRVLTSGGKPTALEGVAELSELVRQAAERITIMPGGGINAANVAEIVAATGCRQVHIGAAGPVDDGSIRAGGVNLYDSRFASGSAYRAVLGDAVAATVTAVRGGRL